LFTGNFYDRVSLDLWQEIRPSFFLIHSSFSARLEGDSRVIRPNQRRIVTVSFTPLQGGLCEAVLELVFHDHKRKADFVVNRTLTGWAKRPTAGKRHHQNGSARTGNPWSQPINDVTDYHSEGSVSGKEELLDSDDTGISVSHEDGLDFGIVERKRPNGPFATPSSVLTIKHANGFSAVTFLKERTRTLDGGDPECVATVRQICLYLSLHQVRSGF